MASTPSQLVPPPAVVTETDRSGSVIIAAALGMAFVLLCLVLRVYLRRAINGPWKYDDSLLAVATLCCVLQASALFVAVSHGFGKTASLLDPDQVVGYEKGLYAGDLLYLVDVYVAKCSVIALLLRLTMTPNHRRVCWAILASSSLWVVISLLAVALRCDPAQPWVVGLQCLPSIYIRWLAIGTVDGIGELALFSMVLYLVWDIQTSLAKKATVISAFAVRLPVIAAIAVRLYYWHSAASSGDFSLDGVNASMWAQVQLSYSIMSCTVPCLRPFMAACHGGWGHTSQSETASLRSRQDGYGSRAGRSRPASKDITVTHDFSVAHLEPDACGSGSADSGDSRLTTIAPFARAVQIRGGEPKAEHAGERDL